MQHIFVGQSPWTATDALVGLSQLSKAWFFERKSVRSGRAGGLPYEFRRIADIGKSMRLSGATTWRSKSGASRLPR